MYEYIFAVDVRKRNKSEINVKLLATFNLYPIYDSIWEIVFVANHTNKKEIKLKFQQQQLQSTNVMIESRQANIFLFPERFVWSEKKMNDFEVSFLINLNTQQNELLENDLLHAHVSTYVDMRAFDSPYAFLFVPVFQCVHL